MTRRQKGEGFLRANEQLVSAYERLDTDARRDLRVPLPFLPSPADVGLFAGMRLSEAALHGWDVRVASDPQATLADGEADANVDQLLGPLSFMLGFIGKGEAWGSTEVTLRVETTAPERVFGLVLGPAVSLGPAPDVADAVLACSSESVVRLFAGRLDAAHTPGDLTLTGDQVTLDQLRATFSGF